MKGTKLSPPQLQESQNKWDQTVRPVVVELGEVWGVRCEDQGPDTVSLYWYWYLAQPVNHQALVLSPEKL